MTERITKSITVKRDVAGVYQAWSNFQNFPHFMKYIKHVEKTGPNTSYWEVQGPLGTTAKWDAEMTRNEANKRIAWNTKNRDGNVTTSGEVTFNALPHNETQINVTLQYTPPGGKAGEIVTNIFMDPEQQVTEDLRNFKAFVE